MRGWMSLGTAMLVGLATVTATVVSCHRAFTCADAEQCHLGGVAGTCEPNGSCSFPDDSCDSGRRYGSHAAAELVGRCVEPDDGTDASTSVADTSTTDSNTTEAETEDDCVLTDSPGLVVSEPGTIIENVRISVSGADAIRIVDATDITIRNVDIELRGHGRGIYAAGANGLMIENVSIVSNVEDPEPGDTGIEVEASAPVVITNVRITKMANGISVDDSDETQLSFIEGHDMRGGHFVHFFLSGGSVLSDFSSENDLDAQVAYPAGLVFVQRSLGVTVRRGLLDGLNAVSGHGINFDTSGDDNFDTIEGLVEDVDAIHMTNGAYGAWTANGVTFRRTRARDNFCTDSRGIFQGEPASGGTTWSHDSPATGIRIEDSTWFDLCRTPPQWPEDGYDVAELQEADFEPRDPVRVQLCWEAG